MANKHKQHRDGWARHRAAPALLRAPRWVGQAQSSARPAQSPEMAGPGTKQRPPCSKPELLRGTFHKLSECSLRQSACPPAPHPTRDNSPVLASKKGSS